MAGDKATYAIVKTGGKQYKVAVGDVVKVEKIEAEDSTRDELLAGASLRSVFERHGVL